MNRSQKSIPSLKEARTTDESIPSSMIRGNHQKPTMKVSHQHRLWLIAYRKRHKLRSMDAAIGHVIGRIEGVSA